MNTDQKQDLRLIGKIKDAHGLRGEVFIIFFSKDYSWSDQLTELFIDQKKIKILNLSQHKDGLKVKLEGLTDRNQSEDMIGKQVYILDSFFSSNTGESLYLAEIENYAVTDKNLGELGVITGFSSNGAQDLLIVKNLNSSELVEIPFVKAFVVEIKHDKKMILMDLPEGLLTINNSDIESIDSDINSENDQ